MSGNGERPALVDARWLGIGGPGRVAEHLLQGLREIHPDGPWTVWGPAEVDQYLWPGASRVANRRHPKALYSQREFPGPTAQHARVAYYAHHLRPGWKLAPVEVTTVHDTIPFRYPPSLALSPLMRGYIGWMARHSTLVVTDSEFSKQCLQEDLGLEPERIAVLRLAIDHQSAERVRALRVSGPSTRRVLFVGRDAPHKNLDNLVSGFAASRFAATGVLTLVGVDGPAVARLRKLAGEKQARVELPGIVPQPQLEQLMASATALVQPSFEEGFGLPVAEALASGIPVAMSTAPALLETAGNAPVETFDPKSVAAIAHAIDRAASAPPPAPVTGWPRPVDFAHSVLAAMQRAEALEA